MLDASIIQPSQNALYSPMMMVTKRMVRGVCVYIIVFKTRTNDRIDPPIKLAFKPEQIKLVLVRSQ